MMRNTMFATLTAAFLSMTLGCNGGSSTALTCKSAASGLTVENGLSLKNGRGINGFTLRNGKGINGVQLNGIKINGLTIKNGIRINSTALAGVTADGRPIDGAGFVGAELTGLTDDGGRLPLRIATYEVDDADPDLAYYAITTDTGENICGEGGKGLFLEGVWDETGKRHDALEMHGELLDTSYSCTTGVLAKCMRWGYKPWTAGADAHQACTRMTRADYCGDGVPHTVEGTEIDVFDAVGVERSGPIFGEGFEFEAGWGPDGAVCVHKQRFIEIGTGASKPSCWASKPRCETWDDAEAQGAMIGNQSHRAFLLTCGE